METPKAPTQGDELYGLWLLALHYVRHEVEAFTASTGEDAYGPAFREKYGERWSHDWEKRYATKRFVELKANAALRERQESRAKAARPTGSDASRIYRDEHNPYGGRNWLVYEMLPERGVAMMAGVSRAGKTFAALDLALSVVTGSPFAGREIDRKGAVLYMAAEGGSEIPLRWKAAKAAQGYADADLAFAWTDALPCRLVEEGALDALLSLIDKAEDSDGPPLALVVVDTLAVAAGWKSENDNAEAARAMDVLQSLSRATGALVVVVDHHGQNKETGPRGATAKFANADAVVSLFADGEQHTALRNRRLIISKCRGGPEGAIIPFELSTVTLGRDAKNRPVTTCTVEWTTVAAKSSSKAEVRIRPTAAKRYDALRAVLSRSGAGSTTIAEWYAECVEHGLDQPVPDDASGDERSKLQASFRARRHELEKAGLVRLKGEVVIDLKSLAAAIACTELEPAA